MTKLLLFILIFILFIRLLNSVFKGIYRIYGTEPKGRSRGGYYQKHREKKGEIHIDNMPNKKGGKFGDDFKGGEYIDYEEVK